MPLLASGVSSDATRLGRRCQRGKAKRLLGGELGLFQRPSLFIYTVNR